MLGSPWLPRILNVRLDTASDPGEYPCRSPERDTNCCLPAGQNRRHSPTKIFGAQHLQGRHRPLPLHLACFRAYASTRLLPVAPQGSILGSRLTITQAGLAPTRTRGLARPHCPPIDPKGKVKKRYPYEEMNTPYDKLKSLPEANRFLRPGITFEQLDAIALALSDNDAARQMNAAKRQLFKTIFEQGRKAV